VDLGRYQRQLIERFANPHVRDTLARLCADTSDRIPKFLLPIVKDNLATGGEVTRSAAVVAGWSRYAEGADEQGEPIPVADPLRQRLTAAARRWPEDPLAFLAQRDIFGDLVDDRRFTAAYTAALSSLHDRGTRATLRDLS
jgi:mannitol 2-dehydrogenase